MHHTAESPYAVVAVIWNPSHEVLAVSRKDNHSDFGLPGGKIDPNETPAQACIREVFEETGLTVVRLHEAFEDYSLKNNGTTSHLVRAFVIDEYNGTPYSRENAVVKLLDPVALMAPSNSYHDYNRRLFNHLAEQHTPS